MKLPPFEYKSPTSLAEAVAILATEGGAARPLAGGQSLLPVLAFRLAAPSVLVDLKRIPDLRRITIAGSAGQGDQNRKSRPDTSRDGHVSTSSSSRPGGVYSLRHHSEDAISEYNPPSTRLGHLF